MVDSSDFETDVGTMDVYARGADPVYVTAPSSSQQEEGVKPLERLPAQWWNWFLHEATSRFSNYKSYISNALAELDNLLGLSAITPDDTKTNQLKGMFENDYLQKYLPEVVSDASTFSVDAAKESSILVSNDDGSNGFDVKKVPYSPCLIYNAQSITTVKTIALPANSPYDGQCFKVVFKNGHNCADASTPMTLNGKPVLVNVDGVLSALPIHEMTEGGSTVYKSLQANTVLDVYYDANYDGSNNDAFVIIGNPVVLSSADYTIYANGNDGKLPANHNIPRLVQKDITAYVIDGTIWKRLNGTDGFALFEDIYVGDYIHMSRPISAYERTGQYQVTGSEYVTIAGIDTMWGNGDQNVISKHHLVMVPGQGFGGVQHFGRSRMNSTDTTANGYKASEMNTATLGAVVSAGATGATATINQQLYAEFGAHLQTTRELVTSSINTTRYNRWGTAGGCSNNWEWISAQAILMSEVEAFGSIVWSSSGYDTGNANRQLPLFVFSKQAQNNRSTAWWLKDIASSEFFCSAHNLGHSDFSEASRANMGVRPRFILA